MSARATIQAIDKRIDALHKSIPDTTARYTQEVALFRERGLAQLERDAKLDEERRRIANQPLRKITCPTCKSSVYATHQN